MPNILNGKRTILFLGVFGLLLIGGFIFFGLYPAAMVNGRFISADKFGAASRVSFGYLEAQKVRLGELAEEMSASRLKAEVMQGLVEDELIAEALEKDIGKEVTYLVEEKMKKFQSKELQETAAAVYGAEWEDIKERILIPQARKDILAERLFLKGQDAAEWLVSAAKSARVKIFSWGFAWDGEKVVVK